VLVLSKERDESRPERLKVPGRGRATLHEGAGATLGGDTAREDDLGRVLLDSLAEVLELRVVQEARRELEYSLNVGVSGPRTDDSGPRPPAEEQVECMSENGLSGAGLARDRRQTPPGTELRVLDQEEILYSQLEEHGPGLPVRPDGAAGPVTLSSLMVRG
jgi:hypothetical protein